MDNYDSTNTLTRRRALVLGSGLVVGGLIATNGAARAAGQSGALGATPQGGSELPVTEIESILEANGTVTTGVLSVEIDREDLKAKLVPGNFPVLPASELNGTLYFQPLESGRAILNGDFCLKPDETNPFIDALIANDLTVQAFHQHLFDLVPIFWFVHFRGIGSPIDLAEAARKAIGVTSTPLPQHTPENPPTPFDPQRLARILGGTAEVGNSGVVTVSVPRAEPIYLAGVHLQPETGVSHTIEFQPLNQSGQHALGMPDFALIGSEVNPVFKTMREQQFTIGCLYNQETDEMPQLYFSHQWAVGNPYDLATKIRKGLNQTNAQFES